MTGGIPYVVRLEFPHALASVLGISLVSFAGNACSGDFEADAEESGQHAVMGRGLCRAWDHTRTVKKAVRDWKPYFRSAILIYSQGARAFSQDSTLGSYETGLKGGRLE